MVNRDTVGPSLAHNFPAIIITYHFHPLLIVATCNKETITSERGEGGRGGGRGGGGGGGEGEERGREGGEGEGGEGEGGGEREGGEGEERKEGQSYIGHSSNSYTMIYTWLL